MTNLPENSVRDDATAVKADADAAPGEKPPRRVFVQLAVLGAVLLTLITASTLAWRWYQDRFPNAIIVTTGDSTAAGVEVVVKADDGHEVARGSLNAENNYQFTVLVEPGFHTVRAAVRDQILFEQRMFIQNKSLAEVKVLVPPALRATMSATQPTVSIDRLIPSCLTQTLPSSLSPKVPTQPHSTG